MSYSFLLEMAWKSALIAGAALLLVALLRSRSAADRGAVLRVGLALLLLLPVVAFAFPALVVETAAPAQSTAAAVPATDWTAAELASPETMATLGAASASADWSDPGLLLFLLYLGGVAMVGSRLVAGLWTLRRWTAEADEVTSREWLDALERSGAGGRNIRLLASAEIESPLSWGWLRPVILLDLDALERTEDADAILAHETAHIVRRDWAALMASRISVALFWFNPLVWLLDREIAQQAEEAADSHAVERVAPAVYAQTLLDWARQSAAAVPANAIAAPQPGLARRVRAILEGRIGRRSGSAWTFGAIALCVGIAAPVAALEFVQQAPEAPEPPEAPLAPPAPAAAEAPPAPDAPPAPPSASAPPAPAPALAMAGVAPVPPRAPRPPRPPLVDGERLAAEIEAAVAESMRGVEASVAAAHRSAAEAQRSAKASMALGADSMLKGADGMEQGARKMEEEARKLQDRDYRERQIAKNAARGERVTHEDLLEAAEGMKEGAEGMREGAREMRRAAEEMRRGG